MEKTLYDILEISRDADLIEIKKAYRRLAKKYHPDITKASSDRFRQINEAYSVLSNDITRLSYDNTLKSENEYKNQYTQTENIKKEDTSNEECVNDSFLQDPLFVTLNNYRYYSIKQLFKALMDTSFFVVFTNLVLYIFALFCAPILRCFMDNLTLLNCSIYVAELKILFYIRSYFYIMCCIFILTLTLILRSIFGLIFLWILFKIFNITGIYK